MKDREDVRKTVESLRRLLESDGSKLSRLIRDIEDAKKHLGDLESQRSNLMTSLTKIASEIETLQDRERAIELEMENVDLRQEIETLRDSNGF